MKIRKIKILSGLRKLKLEELRDELQTRALTCRGLLTHQLMERLSEALLNKDHGDDDNGADVKIETGEISYERIP